jgi:hypothetical protein
MTAHAANSIKRHCFELDVADLTQIMANNRILPAFETNLEAYWITADATKEWA